MRLLLNVKINLLKVDNIPERFKNTWVVPAFVHVFQNDFRGSRDRELCAESRELSFMLEQQQSPG